MDFAAQILFFLGAIGVFNSFLISIYFLIEKSLSSFSNRTFGWFLLVLNLRVLKSVFYSFSTETPIFFLQSGPPFFLLIGPLLFTYVTSSMQPAHLLIRHWKAHILFWVIIVVSLHWFFPFPQHVTLNKEVLLPIINLQWLLYMVASTWVLRPNFSAFKASPIIEKWLLLLVLATFVVWGVFFFAQFQYFISGSIVFSFLFYSFYAYFIFHKKSASAVFKRKRKISLTVNKQETDQLIGQLKAYMSAEKPYTDPNLKSAHVAQQLNLSTHELSRLINDHLDKTFTDFINEYRIEEAKLLIAENSRYTLEAIGNQCGFNSKSAFYKAFKKFQGTTPGKYTA